MRGAILFCGLIVLFGGCSDEYVLDRKEDRLLGLWEFEKVFYKRDVALFRTDITEDFEDDLIEFYPDYTASYDDYSVGEVFYGEWVIFLERVDDERDCYLEAVFYDFIWEEDFFVSGGIDKLNKNKLHLEAFDAAGRYTFKLRRR